MDYVKLKVICNQEFSDILIAELSEGGFDTFLETASGFEAYAETENYSEEWVDTIKEKYQRLTPLEFNKEQIEKKNWNEEWEKNYEPILVENTCLIRAEFHKPDKQYPYEIIITPKMSFGTGHHQTTYLMIQSQLEMDHAKKRVMDAGCGTAILSLMASKLGAGEVAAFDIDEWSVINGKENIQINGCDNITIEQGTIREMKFSGSFDIILANINKNILLDEISLYHHFLAPTGHLLLSGFYDTDLADLVNEAHKYGLKQVSFKTREKWSALLMQKPALA